VNTEPLNTEPLNGDSLVAVVEDTSITLGWSDTATGEDGWYVERRTA
jgi:hypothetical protein